MENRGSRRRNWEFRYVFFMLDRWTGLGGVSLIMNGFGDGDSGNARYI